MADNSISIICATCEKAIPGDPSNRFLLGKTWGTGYEVRYIGYNGQKTLNLALEAFFNEHNTCAMENELCFELRYEGPHGCGPKPAPQQSPLRQEPPRKWTQSEWMTVASEPAEVVVRKSKGH